jgi:hypothetical protein
MRALLLGDVVAAARALLPVAEEERVAVLSALIEAATLADGHRRRSGRSHPRHGDGSLMAAALARGCAREPFLDDRDYCRCLALVLTRLAERGDPPAPAPAGSTGRPLST